MITSLGLHMNRSEKWLLTISLKLLLVSVVLMIVRIPPAFAGSVPDCENSCHYPANICGPKIQTPRNPPYEECCWGGIVKICAVRDVSVGQWVPSPHDPDLLRCFPGSFMCAYSFSCTNKIVGGYYTQSCD